MRAKIELEGICRGVVCRSGFLGLKMLYNGFLETANDELIEFNGSSTMGSTDGDLEASLAKLSSEKEMPALIQGVLRLDDVEPRYGLQVTGINVKGNKSCFYQ